MRFSDVLPTLPLEALVQQSLDTSEETVQRVIARGRATNLIEFAALISPAAQPHLEALAGASMRLTQKHFGKTIRMFAPLYLSNECINICTYCGFSRHNQIPRITTPLPQVVDETRKLTRKGFRALLLVAGEHPKYVSNGYVAEVIRELLPIMPNIGIELGPLETEAYRSIVDAGAENLICYQESYHPETYASLHPAGPKKHFNFRLDTPERGYEAGFKRVGIGPLFGLHNWRYEALATAAHGLHLLRHCWRAQLSVALPRMRPAAGTWTPNPEFHMFDRDLVQAIAAFRLLLPHAAISLSTREHPALRNGLVRLGVTHMSAGSSTEPGGYSTYDEEQWVQTKAAQEGEQFHISDTRSPHVVAEMIRQQGYEPVWKDYDLSLARGA
ncbi:MAG: 2-iminoacetate synthase ThiH [Verrucomicrobiota bacterium JB022]|nr:2-iminoacetate synthase ThiH [Verrucomicrobiota bacterium JB022]